MTNKIAYAALVAALVGPATAREPKPSNHVAVLLDTSGSYRSRVSDASKRVIVLLEGMSKQEIHRWDKTTDQIVLIGLDASPAVIWEGTLKDLQESDKTVWEQRVKARTDFARCTDIDAAFALAAEKLQGDSRHVRKYLFAFTDMQHEPPTSSLSTCAAPRLGPSESFPWSQFQEISVSIFWMPARQILPWRRAIVEQGLKDSFQLYSESESGAVKIAAPPRPKRVVTDEERDASSANLTGLVKKTIIGLGLVLVVMILLATLLSRRRPSPRPAGGSRPATAFTTRNSVRPATANTRRI